MVKAKETVLKAWSAIQEDLSTEHIDCFVQSNNHSMIQAGHEHNVKCRTNSWMIWFLDCQFHFYANVPSLCNKISFVQENL